MSSYKQKLNDTNDRLLSLFKADQKSMLAFKNLSDATVSE
jgi:hypothetical protein